MNAHRNHLFLWATMVHLGLSRADLAKLCAVRDRTVSHWLAGRNQIPSKVWRALASVRQRIHERVTAWLDRWEREGRPKVFEIPIPLAQPSGPVYAAAYEVIERLGTEHVFVTLRPAASDRFAPMVTGDQT